MNPIVTFILSVAGIALIDIVLSGDNALVIGAAASRLPSRSRTIAIIWGGVAALVFRIVLTIGATEVLRVPLLQSLGGLALLFIACQMLLPEKDESDLASRASDRLLRAIFTILVADATMSIDNILAIGALAHGDILLVTIGLLISMALLFIASALIAQLIEHIPLLLDLAALVIAYTAATLVLGDPLVNRVVDFNRYPAYTYAVEIGCVAVVLVFDVAVRLRRASRPASKRSRDDTDDVPTPSTEATLPAETVPETD